MTAGFLNVNKPRGMTSFRVVAQARRLTGVRRVGHAGTLDPSADGVLPICLGQATRLVQYLMDQPKRYLGAVRLGVSTDTYDGDGTPTATRDAGSISRADIEAVLPRFVGEIDQVPPIYSALKRGGRRLYDYARLGQTVSVEARQVAVHRLEIVRYAPPVVEVEIDCGRGAYVRTIAHDLGQVLGCGAHLERLTRLQVGPFRAEDAITLGELEEAAKESRWEMLLSAPDRVLESWPAALLADGHVRDARHGRPLQLEPASQRASRLQAGTRCRAYSCDGAFLAILQYQGGSEWKAEKVFGAQ